jgi:hypothetical protein
MRAKQRSHIPGPGAFPKFPSLKAKNFRPRPSCLGTGLRALPDVPLLKTGHMPVGWVGYISEWYQVNYKSGTS